MLKNRLLSMIMVVSLFSLPQVSFAENECKSDKDCKDNTVCVLAANPPVCKPPQPAGAACKRDAVCSSGKCDIPADKDVGSCK